MREEFTALALAGQGPELLRGANDLTAPLVGAGTIRPAGALYDGAVLGQFFPGALSAAVISDTVWALPDNYGSHLMLLYNKKLVQDVPVDTRAWIDQLKTLTDRGERPIWTGLQPERALLADSLDRGLRWLASRSERSARPVQPGRHRCAAICAQPEVCSTRSARVPQLMTARLRCSRPARRPTSSTGNGAWTTTVPLASTWVSPLCRALPRQAGIPCR